MVLHGKPFAGGHGCNVTVFDAAKTAILGCRPHSSIAIESKTGNMALTQPVSGGIGRANLTILEILDATIGPE